MMESPLGFGELVLLSITGLIAFFGAWSLAAVVGLAPPQFLPPPWIVAAKFVELTREPFVGSTLQQHLLSSFLRSGMGFGLGALIAVPLGLAMGGFRCLEGTVSPLSADLRFVRPFAWFPF